MRYQDYELIEEDFSETAVRILTLFQAKKKKRRFNKWNEKKKLEFSALFTKKKQKCYLHSPFLETWPNDLFYSVAIGILADTETYQIKLWM